MDQTVNPTPFYPLGHVGDIIAFRAAVAGWLNATVPPDWRQNLTGASEETYLKFQNWWFDQLKSVGLATPHWPKSWGGAGLPLSHQVVMIEELARIGGPMAEMFVVSLFHMPATLFANGSPAQCDRYLTGVRDRGEIWCQGFSEPGAGSDLSALRTRAERKGDVYVVNGQKVWSSFGMHADFCLLLARTNPQAPKKNAGISYFILDMRAAGVTVRPIRQITGRAEFTEIFLDNVEIPVENLIGAENAGWQIAQSTLAAERGLLIFEHAERMTHALRRDYQALTEQHGKPLEDAGLRREFTKRYAELTAVRLLIKQMIEQGEHGQDSGLLAAVIKLYWAQLLQNYTSLMARMRGLDAQRAMPLSLGTGHNSGDYLSDFLQSYGWTIAGGTNEIMRTLIAERILGLPR
ncbi:MAG: acyl-CoA dehydrogenase family protein [Acidocella sp.]|nr:acyl-CoA dehydrogenase family protein [Acidocella sp.]